MKLYELQKECSPKRECPLSKYCMTKEYSRVRPACVIEMDNIEETVEERASRWENYPARHQAGNPVAQG